MFGHIILIISLLIELDQSQQLIYPEFERCQCLNIVTIDDCLATEKCSWVIQQQGNCQLLTSTNVTDSYSLNCAVKSNIQCLSSPECAFIGSFCTFFSGCTAYDYTTTGLCQSISNQCVSDGEACINIENQCSQYLNSYSCENSQQTVLGLSCRWNNSKCENQDCINAPDTFQTNEECTKWQPYCVSIGKGCDTVLKPCESYDFRRGCDGLIGIEGRCATNSKINKCRVATCSDAPTNLTTDAQCDSYVKGCFTFGRGCIKTKKPCKEFVKTQDCENLEGSDGNCIDDLQNNNCKLRECSDANSTINTNQGCNEFLAGCITTGYGCSREKLSCQQINPSLGCSKYNGTDGPCIEFLENNQIKCRAMTCDEIPPTYAQFDGCGSFKQGCLSNGIKCTNYLNLCRDYNSTYFQQGCENLKGVDGDCIEDKLNQGYCRVKECEDASQTYQNDTKCNEFKSGCFSNGRGCTKSKQPCSSYDFSQGCSRFVSDLGRCGNQKDSSQCTIVQCSDAPSNYTTDYTCSQFWYTCFTNGRGCTNYKQPCNQYNINQSCDGYLDDQGPCIDSQDGSGMCRQAQCEDAPQYFHKNCENYKKGCISSGIGCVSVRQDCRNYNLEQGCQNIIGNNGQCWNQQNSDKCKLKSCSDAPNNTDCANFLEGCLDDGKICVEKRKLCSEYSSNDCAGHIGSNGNCLLDKQNQLCRPYICTHFKGITDAICDQKLKGCKTDGEICQSNLSCSQYLYASTCIIDSLNNKCIWNRKLKECIQFTKWQDYLGLSNEDCQIISPYCVTNGRFCIPKNFCRKYAEKISCFSGVDGLCGWNSKNNTCQNYKPDIKYMSSSLEECKSWNQKFITDGIQCIPMNYCQNYITQTSCSQLDLYQRPCKWKNGYCEYVQCHDFVFDNYQQCIEQNTKNTCTTDGTKCIEQNKCVTYNRVESCQQGTDGYCIWALLSNTSSKAIYGCRIKLCQDYSLKTSPECKEAQNNCVSNGNNCIDIQFCQNYNNHESCSGGGVDGVCVFMNGKCKLFESCQEASQDEVACKFRSDSCYFNVDTKNVTSCNIHTCDTKAKGSTCQPIPNFALIGYQICQMSNNQCVPVKPIDLNRTSCFLESMQTYVWNGYQCQQCLGQQVQNNSTNTPPTEGTSGKLLFFIQYFITALF